MTDWGFEYYKLDREYAIPKYVPMVDTNILYNKLADPPVTYRNHLKLICDTMGPGKFIEGCPAGTSLNGIGYFNPYFNGHDMYSSWQRSYPMLSSINANSFLNHIVVYNMAGEGVELLPQAGQVNLIPLEGENKRAQQRATLLPTNHPNAKELSN